MADPDMQAEEAKRKERAALLFAQGLNNYYAKDYINSVTLIKQGLELNPNKADAYFNLARCYNSLKMYKEAEEAITRAVELDAKQSDFQNYFGLIMLGTENYAKAVDCFTKAIEIKQNDHVYFDNRGYAYYNLHMYDKALEDVNKALDLATAAKESPRGALVDRALIYLEQKRNAEAITDLEKVLELNPGDKHAEELILRAGGQLKKTAQAPAQPAGSDTSLQVAKAKGYFDKKDYVAAAEIFKKIYDSNPNDASAVAWLSRCYYNLSDYGNASSYALATLKLAPNNDNVLNILGLMASENNDLNAALDYFNRALIVVPKDSVILANRARVFYKMGKYEEAIADCNKSLGFRPKSDWVLLQRARCYVKLNRKNDAINDLKGSLAITPNYTDALDLLSELSGGIRLTEEDVKRGLTSFNTPEIPKITFSDVVGMDALKDELRNAVIYPFLNPDLAKEYDIRIGGGILLYGPPGCGKTWIIKAAAGGAKLNFIDVRISDIMDVWIGNSERNIHNVFELARKNSPCILFFDEIDALGAKRESVTTSSIRQVINTFLTELDGASSSNDKILVVGATNIPWGVDYAISRPGRLGNFIYVPAPDHTARSALFKHYLKTKPVEEDIDYEKLADATQFFSTADIAFVTGEAAKIPWNIAIKTGVKRKVNMEDLTSVISKQKPVLPEWYENARVVVSASSEKDRYQALSEAIGEYTASKQSDGSSYR